MARFTVYRLKSGDLVVDCQADVLSHFRTRVVAPLLAPSAVPAAIPRLHPTFRVGGSEWLLGTHLLGAIVVDEISEEVGSLASRDTEISNALDFLMIGF